jgi:xylulokinase
MSDTLLLGVDIGSTRMKGALFNTEGQQAALTYVEYPILHNEPLAAEHSATNWLLSFKKIVRRTLRIARVQPDSIAAVSVDCLCPSLIPVNRRGKPLMNSIFFMDRRCIDDANWMEKKIGSKTSFQLTGNRISHSAFSAPIMMWIKRTRPKIFAETYKFLHGNGFIERYLTNEFTMDWTNASFTLLFETRGRNQWSTNLCGELNMPLEKLPDLKAPWDVVGEVTREASKETGLARGTPVVAGGADTSCAVLGVGAVENGDAMEDGGTATKLAVSLDKPNFPIGTLNRCHVVPNRWLAVAASSTTGAAFRWLKDLLPPSGNLADSRNGREYKWMDSDAEKSPPGANGLIVLPYFAPGGERSPIWNPYARGVIFGLTLAHNRRDIVRAFMEASAYALAHNIEMIERQGINVKKIRVSGGQAKSRLWRRIKADVTGKPTELTSHVEATVFGTALLAGFGSGSYSNLASTIRKLVHVRETIRPLASNTKIYRKNFAAYKAVYERLRTEFQIVYS